MSSQAVGLQEQSSEGGFDVVTVHSDNTRAVLRLRGTLTAANAPLLAEVIEGNLRAGRRFLRLAVSGLSVTDRAGIDVLVCAHHRLLDVRGTLILTGVSGALASALSAAGVDQELFLLAPSAAEVSRSFPGRTHLMG